MNPEDGPLGHMITYLTASEVLRIEPNEAELQDEVSGLPLEGLIRACSFLLHVLHEGHRFGIDPQLHAIDAFVPAPLQRDIREWYAKGYVLIYPDQLLGLMRLGILHCRSEEQTPLTLEQQRAFFRALLRYGDHHTADFVSAGDDLGNAAANALRGLALPHNTQANVISRAYAIWVQYLADPEIEKSPYWMDLRTEFQHVTGGHDPFTHIVAGFSVWGHGDLHPIGDPAALQEWEFDPKAWLRTVRNKPEMLRALDAFAGTRDDLAAAFRAMPTPPRYHLLAMRPFRRFPVYRRRDGLLVMISHEFLLNALNDGIYWVLHDHIRDVHGEAQRSRFTQFYAWLFEKFVLDFTRSAMTGDAHRVYGEADATPSTAAADVAVWRGTAWGLIEVTKSAIRYDETLLTGDLKAIRSDIARFATKARQGRDAADRLRDGAVRYEGHDSPEDRALPIRRVVVLADGLPRFPLLNEITREELAKAGVEPEAVIISVDELMQASGRDDPERLWTLIDAWRADPRYAETSLNNFLIFENHEIPGAERAALIEELFAALKRETSARLFDS